MSPTYTRGTTCFVQSIWGNQVKIPRISQMPNNQRHTSQVGFKLFTSQSGAIRPRVRESLRSINNQGHAPKWVRSYFPISQGHHPEFMSTRGITHNICPKILTRRISSNSLIDG